MPQNPSYKIFNKHSAVDCDERAFERHSAENDIMLCILNRTAEHAGGTWVVRSTYEGPLGQGKQPAYLLAEAHGLEDLLQSVDLKNGFDVGFIPGRSPSIALVAHGGHYSVADDPSRIEQVTEILQCRLLAAGHVDARDGVSADDMKELFHAQDRHVSLQPCLKECKRAMGHRQFLDGPSL